MGPSEPTFPNYQHSVGKGLKERSPLSSGAMSSKLVRKTYSDSALREGILCSLRGAAADTVKNPGPYVPLDTIIKKFTIVYGNVKSFDLLMWDFYHADQGEEESIPSFATQVEGLLSQIHDKFLEKLTHPEEQRLLKDRLFHGCKKSIWDSVK